MPTAKIAQLVLFLLLLLTIASAQQRPFPVTSTVDAPTIAGHPVQLDAQGKLLPWPMPENTGYSYSSHFLTQWTILWDQYNRQRLPYFYCCFDYDRTTFELAPDAHWANSTAYLRAMMQGFIERLYPYTGDARTLEFLQSFVDYELDNGLTPEGYAWAQVPYASANPGAKRYSGWSQLGEDYIEPHVVGEDGYGYLRLYEMTGNTKYLRAAIRCADALVRNYRTGDERHSPWPVRCYARDGKSESTPAMGPYSANVIEPIMLFDELMRLKQGDIAGYLKVRAGSWEWFQKYPLANNVWVGYFEDTTPNMDNMNQVIPLEFARYVLLHPGKDPQWREHSRRLIEWVKTTPKWPKYVVHGATVTTEQGNGTNFCCNLPNQCCDSHTSRLAAVEALYFARTGDVAYRDAAFRSYNWVSYFQGLSAEAPTPFSMQWWFTDEYADGPRRLMDGFWAVPEWAPSDESHLLGSSSVVSKISYGKGSVTYSTFDQQSSDVLRLDFVPDSVTANGKPLGRRKDPSMNPVSRSMIRPTCCASGIRQLAVGSKNVAKDIVVIAQIFEFRIGERGALSRLTTETPSMEVRVGKQRQLFGVGHREGAQQHRIEYAENGGVGTDAQRQREYGNQGEPGAVREHARCIPQVFPKGIHVGRLPQQSAPECGHAGVPANAQS